MIFMVSKRIKLLAYKKMSYSSEELALLAERKKIQVEKKQVSKNLDRLRAEESELLSDKMAFIKSSINEYYFNMLMKNNENITLSVSKRDELDKALESNQKEQCQIKSKIKSVEKNIELLQERVNSSRMEQSRNQSLSEIMEHICHDTV